MSSAVGRKPILFGTSNGMLGMLFSVSAEAFVVLSDLEAILGTSIASAGNLSHTKWRQVIGSDGDPLFKIIDGDIVQQYLDLSDDARLELIAVNPQMEPAKVLKALTEIEGL